jgi:hypothetical protein
VGWSRIRREFQQKAGPSTALGMTGVGEKQFNIVILSFNIVILSGGKGLACEFLPEVERSAVAGIVEPPAEEFPRRNDPD